MPRARISHASFIAGAESPLLPFLAPRAFAESPVLRRSGRHNGKSNGAQKEEETVGGDTSSLRTTHTAFSNTRHAWRNPQCPPLRHASEGPASALLHTAIPRSTRPPSALDLCYANISAFARQHIRSYSSASNAPRKVGSRRRGHVPSTDKTAVVDTKPHILRRQGPKLTENDSPTTSSTSPVVPRQTC
jgi:hypothetical protein